MVHCPLASSAGVTDTANGEGRYGRRRKGLLYPEGQQDSPHIEGGQEEEGEEEEGKEEEGKEEEAEEEEESGQSDARIGGNEL